MSSKPKTIQPPSGLHGDASAWYRRMVREFAFDDDPAGLELLGAASWQLSRMAAARESLKKDGLIIEDRFEQKKEHPAASVERAASNLFRLLCRELGVGEGHDEAARITRSKRG